MLYNYELIRDVEQKKKELNIKLLELETLFDIGVAISSVLDINDLGFKSRSIDICSGLTLGSCMERTAPSSIRFLQINIDGDSLVSFVFVLNANPKTANFLPETVPKRFLTISSEILFFCQ